MQRLSAACWGNAEDTFTRMPTALVNLSPAFMAALQKVAPKKRRSRLPFVLALAVLAVFAILASDRSTREFASAKVAARFHRAPSAQPVNAPSAPEAAPAVVVAAAAPAAAPANDPNATTSVPVATREPAPSDSASATSSTSSSSPSTKKATKKGQRRVNSGKKPTSMVAAKIPGPARSS
jgi:hypothetical protein